MLVAMDAVGRQDVGMRRTRLLGRDGLLRSFSRDYRQLLVKAK